MLHLIGCDLEKHGVCISTLANLCGVRKISIVCVICSLNNINNPVVNSIGQLHEHEVLFPGHLFVVV